jgi:hypothetical protein
MIRSVDISRVRCVKDERGAAIMTVIVLITIGLAVGGAAVVTATTTMRGSVRDESSKDSLAAADAGIQAALMRQNQVAVDESNPCVVESSGALVAGDVGEGGWCSPMSGSAGDATYEYRVRPAVETDRLSRLEVVSTGTSNDVNRRVHVQAESITAEAVFGTHSVIGKDSISLDSNAYIHGNTGTNGSVSLLSNAHVCGAAQYGTTFAPSSYTGSNCPSSYPFSKSQGTLSLPQIDQGDVVTLNDNHRITTGEDPITERSSVSWSPTDRTLTLDSNSTITMGGNDYSLCRLRLLSNSQLIVAGPANVRIFFDAPENCPTLGSGPQIVLDSNTKLTTTDGQPGSLQLLVVGSSNPSVTSDNVHLNSNSTSTMPLIVYAPNSAISLDSNSTLLGAVAGQSISLNSNARITAHADGSGLQLPVPLQYRQARFVECASTSAPPTAPSSNC